MQKTNTTAVKEIRNIVGKVWAKYYPEQGIIEIRKGEYVVQILIPPMTQIEVHVGRAVATK